MIENWTTLAATILPACAAIAWLGIAQLRAKGLQRLGGGFEAAVACGLLGVILSIFYAPWQWMAVQQAFPWLGAGALAYLMAGWLRHANEAQRLRAGHILTGLLAVAALLSHFSRQPSEALWLITAMLCAIYAINHKNSPRRFPWNVAAVICLIAAFLPPSKFMLAGLLAMGGLWIWVKRKQALLSRRKGAALAFIVCASIFAAIIFWPRGTQVQMAPDVPSAQERFSLAKIAGGDTIAALRTGWLLGNERMFTGWGLGSGPVLYPKVAAQTWTAPLSIPNLGNTPSQLFAETGVLGLFAFFWIGYLIFKRLRRTLNALRDGAAASHATTIGAGCALLCLGAVSLVATVFDNPLIIWTAGALLGVFAADTPEAKPFPAKTRWVAAILAAAVVIGGLAQLSSYGYACQAARNADFTRALGAYPAQFAFANAKAAAAKTPQAQMDGWMESLQANPYQPAIWAKAAQLAYQMARWDAAFACAQNAYRLSPNSPQLLPLLAAIEAARGQAQHIPVLLALEILNEPAILLKQSTPQTEALWEQAANIALKLNASLRKDLPQYGSSFDFAKSVWLWARTQVPPPLETIPASARPFWEAVGGQTSTETTAAIAQTVGWACLLQLWQNPQERAYILNEWYVAHPAQSATPQKKAAILAQLDAANTLPEALRPLSEATEPNPLWADLALDSVFPERGALPPSVRIPLYEGLIASPPNTATSPTNP